MATVPPEMSYSYETECAGKRRWTMKAYAKEALRRMERRQALHAYRCSHCGGWHVGHKPKAPPRRVAPVSSKRRAEAATRAEIRCDALWRARYRCQATQIVPEVTCHGPLDVDEIVGRGVYPGGHLDPDNVQVLCRAHHDWKHTHPAEAHARGLRKESWECPPSEK